MYAPNISSKRSREKAARRLTPALGLVQAQHSPQHLIHQHHSRNDNMTINDLIAEIYAANCALIEVERLELRAGNTDGSGNSRGKRGQVH